MGRPFLLSMFTTKQITAIVLIVLLVFVLVQNSYGVRIKFLVFFGTLPLSVLILIVFLAGVLIGYWLNRNKSRGAR